MLLRIRADAPVDRDADRDRRHDFELGAHWHLGAQRHAPDPRGR